jgi:large subunit ribosomal protein L9
MKVILLKDVPKIGTRGQICEVSDGYAKNFLLAKKLASVATPEVQAKVAKESRELEDKKKRQTSKLQELKKDLETKTFTIKVKVGDKGQIFGGAHEKDIVSAINTKLGTDFEKNTIHIDHPIKQLGVHKVSVKLGSGIVAVANIIIEALQ